MEHVPKDVEDEDEVKNLVVDDENDKTVVPCIAISEDLGDIQVSVEGNYNWKKYKSKNNDVLISWSYIMQLYREIII